MKIAVVSTVLPETHYTVYLAKALEDLFAREFRHAEILVLADRNPKNLACGLKNVQLAWSKGIWFMFQLTRSILMHRPDIVHFQHEVNMYGPAYNAVLLPVIIPFLRLFGIRSIVTIHAVVPRGEVDRDLCNTFGWPATQIHVLVVRMAMKFMFRSLGYTADRIIVHSGTVERDLVHDYGVPKNKITVIPHGVLQVGPTAVAVEHRPSSEEWMRPILERKRRVVLFFGYVARRKGIELLLEAWRRIIRKNEDLFLVIAGAERDSRYFKEVKEYVSSLGLDNSITFTGFVSWPEIDWLFRHAEALVLPYKYSISASGPLALATGYGVPCVVPDIGTFKEEVINGTHGLVFESGNVDSLADAIERILHDYSLANRIRCKLAEKAKARSWNVVAELTFNTYRKVIKGL